MLRDPKEVGIDPIVRPRSKEIPADHVNSRYQLAGEIARGGMGAIIKGRDIDLGRDLAIKVLLDSHKDKPEVVQRFIEEAQIGGQLQHPGIVPVYELGQFGDERPFFSMKLVKGQTLAQVLGARKHLSEDRAKYLGIFEQICQTMAYAHSRGVIHRDLKPANIMVGAFGEVQVMDWGLAKVLAVGGIADEKKSLEKQTEVSIIRTLRSVGSDSPGSLGSQTQMGSVMGTPAYMSPEQALGEVDRLDERTDVFGLGAILCEILTGKPPYVAASGEQVSRMASRGKLEDCYARLDASIIDHELLQIVRDVLALEPDDRLRDAGVLAERFSRYLESVESRLRQAEIDRATETARAEEALKTAAQELVSRKEAQGRVVEEKRRRRMTMALAASLLIGMIISGWFAVHAGRQRSLAFIAQQQAEQERKVADLAREDAELERNRAGVSEQTAMDERDKSNAINTELTKSKENQRRLLYGAQMNLVQKAWEMDDAIQVQKLLNATRQRPGETDLRGIEWHYWQLKLHEEDRVLQLPLRVFYRGVRDLPSGVRSGSPPKDVAVGTTLSHDGRRLAAITRSDHPSNTDLVLKVWSTESDSIEPIFSWNLPYKTVPMFPAGTTRALTNSPLDNRLDGCRIEFLDAERVVISAGSELQTFRLDATAEAQPVQAHPPITVRPGFKFNQDGSRIATPGVISKEGESNPQPTILILDGRTGEQIDQFPNPIPNATVRALSPDATRMVVQSRASFQIGVQTNPGPDLQFAIVDVATRNSVTVSPRSMRILNNHPAAGSVGTEFSPDGTRLAVDHPASGSVTIVDAATGSELFSIPNNAHSLNMSSLSSSGTSSRFSPAPFVAFSSDGKWLTSTSGINQVTKGLKVWEAATGKLGTEFKGHTSAPARTPSEPSGASASAFARPNGDVLPSGRISAVSSDRRWTASAPASSRAMVGRGGPVATWTSGEPPFEIELKDGSGRIPPHVLPLAAPAEKLTFSPDGSLLVSVSVDESVTLDEAAELKVWSVATVSHSQCSQKYHSQYSRKYRWSSNDWLSDSGRRDGSTALGRG